VMKRMAEKSMVEPALVTSFGRWMRQQRGTCDATLYNYSLHVRDLLKSLGEDPSRFEAPTCVSLSWKQVNGVDGRRPKSAPPPFVCFCAS